MKCKICGRKSGNNFMCSECKEKIDFLSAEIMNGKKKINLNFNEHHNL